MEFIYIKKFFSNSFTKRTLTDIVFSSSITSNRILIERDEDGILRLSIRFVCEEDSGIYELKVWNDYGKASCRGKLICESKGHFCYHLILIKIKQQ